MLGRFIALLSSMLSAINWWMAKARFLILHPSFSLLCPEDAEHDKHLQQSACSSFSIWHLRGLFGGLAGA
jgi:hypothetical protein